MKLRVQQDTEGVESPRDADCNLGVMVCFHTNYTLGDESDISSSWFDGWADMEDHLWRAETDEHETLGSGEGAVCVLPLFLYDHSGLAMSTGKHPCRWDSGQVGFIYTTAARIKEFLDGEDASREAVEKHLQNEVKVYDQYLSGDIWGYEIYKTVTCDQGHEHDEVLDSCWGFYGHETAQQEGEDVLKALQACRD